MAWLSVVVPYDVVHEKFENRTGLDGGRRGRSKLGVERQVRPPARRLHLVGAVILGAVDVEKAHGARQTALGDVRAPLIGVRDGGEPGTSGPTVNASTTPRPAMARFNMRPSCSKVAPVHRGADPLSNGR